MTHFYRYLRPLEFNFKRHAVEVTPNGGVCFRVEDPAELPHLRPNRDERMLTVSYSICNPKDLFDKEVAKKIADQRWEACHKYSFLSRSVSANMIAKAIIDFYLSLPQDPTGATLELYRTEDLRLLAQRLQSIWAGHRSAWHLSDLSRETIKAIGIEKAYERIQGRQHT